MKAALEQYIRRVESLGFQLYTGDAVGDDKISEMFGIDIDHPLCNVLGWHDGARWRKNNFEIPFLFLASFLDYGSLICELEHSVIFERNMLGLPPTAQLFNEGFVPTFFVYGSHFTSYGFLRGTGEFLFRMPPDPDSKPIDFITFLEQVWQNVSDSREEIENGGWPKSTTEVLDFGYQIKFLV